VNYDSRKLLGGKMYKRLDEEAIENLLERGIDEFSDKGLDRANINNIAKAAGLSVGVVYKYYEDKDQFFLACVEHSLRLLETAMKNVIENEVDVLTCMKLLIKELMDGADKHQNYYKMYNEITSGSCSKYAVELANKIEGNTSNIYTQLVAKAQREGKIAFSGDPKMFSFFFDSLLMMLQYSFSCEYYRERMMIFCGKDVLENKERLADNFLEFMARALGIAI